MPTLRTRFFGCPPLFCVVFLQRKKLPQMTENAPPFNKNYYAAITVKTKKKVTCMVPTKLQEMTHQETEIRVRVQESMMCERKIVQNK